MKDKFPSWRPFLILINFHSNETSNAWLRKGEKLPKETVQLFIVLFISLFFALFKFSAHSSSMPEIHSIPLLFQGILAVDNGN